MNREILGEIEQSSEALREQKIEKQEQKNKNFGDFRERVEHFFTVCLLSIDPGS